MNVARALRVLTAILLGFGTTLCMPDIARADRRPPLSAITALLNHALVQYHLKSIIMQVRSNGENVYTGALGESMTGVPARPEMHFRNGAMAFTYMSTLLLRLVDLKMVGLDDKLVKFFPRLPNAGRISLKNLANMTSGYADYVYEPEVLRGTTLDPFRGWTSEQLIAIGVTHPMMFAPATNWGYSHTNYVILGRVIEQITKLSLARAMQAYVFLPIGLQQTRSSATPQIPEPVLHAFTSERRADLGVAPHVPFYEESTFWNRSWTTAQGAVQTTDISDMNKSIEAVGTGKVLSKRSFAAQVEPNLIGFGHYDPKCSACRLNSKAFSYGLGVIIVDPWITQSKFFAGAGAAVGYLQSKRLAIAVATTLASAAFDDKGNSIDPSSAILSTLADLLAPDTIPQQKTRGTSTLQR